MIIEHGELNLLLPFDRRDRHTFSMNLNHNLYNGVMSLFINIESNNQPGINHLGRALRTLQDFVAATGASEDRAEEAALAIEEISALLEPDRYIAARDKGWDDSQRARGARTLNPAYITWNVTKESFIATVSFGSFYLGGNGAVHGGAIPLLFDQVLGQLVNFDRPVCRTAYLNVDFRNVTPLDTELEIRAHFEKIEGRKHFTYGGLYNGDILTAEARALFIELKDGAA